MSDEKPILKLVEIITIEGPDGETIELEARIDTGAQNSSVDLRTAQQLRLGPIVRTKTVRNSHGTSLRPVVTAKIYLAGKKIEEHFTIANRSNMRYRVLIGQNILKKGFLIDPTRE